MLGTAPGADDLIVPSREGRNRSANHMLKKLYEDLDRLGFRRRRIHDRRRTFISLALADGGRKDILRWITHGPKGDVFDDYTTLPWPALCEEVAKLKVAPPARVPELPGCGRGLRAHPTSSELHSDLQSLVRRPRKLSKPP